MSQTHIKSNSNRSRVENMEEEEANVEGETSLGAF
jgi:hypothetical protein